MDQAELAEHLWLMQAAFRGFYRSCCLWVPSVSSKSMIHIWAGHQLGLWLPSRTSSTIKRWYRMGGSRKWGKPCLCVGCVHVHAWVVVVAVLIILNICGCVQVESGGCCWESSPVIIPAYSFRLYLLIKLRACLCAASHLALGYLPVTEPFEVGITGGFPTHLASMPESDIQTPVLKFV